MYVMTTRTITRKIIKISTLVTVVASVISVVVSLTTTAEALLKNETTDNYEFVECGGLTYPEGTICGDPVQNAMIEEKIDQDDPDTDEEEVEDKDDDEEEQEEEEEE